MKNIINTKNVDYTKQPIFFGEGLNLQRYDVFRYKKLFDIFKDQLSFFWRPEEVNVGLDGGQFKELSENEKFIFTQNLKYQILLDSVQSRGISYLTEHTSSPEFEAAAKAWEFFETLHSYSYTYVIKNIYANPGEVFDNILNDEELLKRTTSVTKYYDELINSIPEDTEYDRKKKLFLTLISINILEGIRFYVSFACSYSFAERGKMEGNAKIISFINRDENLHLALTQNIINYLKKNADEGFTAIVADTRDIVIQMYKDAAQEEIDWAKYIFKHGSVIGLNEEILSRYMMYLTNKRMRNIGYEPIFEKTENPINWINNWTNSKDVQEAPQETEKESYVIGGIKQDVNKYDFNKFKI